jgi:cell wall-associated NlpC family hydrolase
MHFALGYIGKPFAAYAEGPDAYSCWGLCRVVLARHFGIDVRPIMVDPKNIRACLKAFRDDPEYAAWFEVGAAREGDLVLMSTGDHPIHVGIWLDVDGGRVLHADNAGVVCETPAAITARGSRILRTIRHRSRA